ncbi:MAG: Wzy polymerase domain-containing protein [Polaromonas sp.]|nr:Wzy polymerase domain-containing protein [Polaromonas sp.]
MGIVAFSGSAWISSAYLLGFLLALLTGAHWELYRPGQLTKGLFAAIIVAAILSVGLQIKQSLEVDGLWIWTIFSSPTRPSANLGQPNQLATLLLWGIVANLWAVAKRHIGAGTAVFLALYLLFGLALTGSRTAWLGLVLILLVIWIWRGCWLYPRLPWIATALGLYFAACVKGQAFFNHSDDVLRLTTELRPAAWRMFIDAALQQPWLGYGWNQTALAHTAMADRYPSFGLTFTYAHNLFLDWFLWCGIPLGLIFSGALIYWFWGCLRAVKSAENIALLTLLGVVGNHAMLELPLAYAYFLLPVGMVMGVLTVQLNEKPVCYTHRWLSLGLWSISTALLVLIVRDYTRIEPSYQNMRMTLMLIKVAPMDPPDVFLLDQMKKQIEMARFVPRADLDGGELQNMRDVASLFPSGIFSQKLAITLALNGHPEEARLWLIRLCKLTPDCTVARTIWVKQAQMHPEIVAIPWPVKEAD